MAGARHTDCRYRSRYRSKFVNVVSLDRSQRTVFVFVIAAFVAAAAAPYPLTKVILGVTLALFTGQRSSSVLTSVSSDCMCCYFRHLQLLPLERLKSTWTELADGLSDHLRRRRRKCRSTPFPPRASSSITYLSDRAHPGSSPRVAQTSDTCFASS